MKEQKEKTASCNSWIVINSSKIPTAEREQWQADNLGYFANSPVGNLIDIDPSKIDSKDFDQWLVDNQNYISYDDSYEYIECVHNVTKFEDLKQLENAEELCRMTFSDVITKMENATIDFTTPSYEKYASLSIQGAKLVVTPVTAFDKDNNCYSVPFFKSILYNNVAIDTTSILVFKKPTSAGNLNHKLCICVEVSGTIIRSYDFSQTPP